MESILTIDSYSEIDLSDVASRIVELLPTTGVIAIKGEMGVGKTTLVKSICTTLGVSDSISSPTFSVINEYQLGGGKIYHIDLYRLNSVEEVESAGVFDTLNSGGLSFVEWPERIADNLPDGVWVLNIELCEKFNQDGRRRLDLQRP